MAINFTTGFKSLADMIWRLLKKKLQKKKSMIHVCTMADMNCDKVVDYYVLQFLALKKFSAEAVM